MVKLKFRKGSRTAPFENAPSRARDPGKGSSEALTRVTRIPPPMRSYGVYYVAEHRPVP